MMYEEGEEGWERAAAFDLQTECQGEKYWCDFLYKKVNGVPYFFQESKLTSTCFSDGMTWLLNGIKYEDGYFKQMEAEISFSGSEEPQPDYLAKAKDEFMEAGLNIDNIDYEQHAFDLSPGLIKLASIQADLNAVFYEIDQSDYDVTYCVDGIDIIISDYTRAGMSVVQAYFDSKSWYTGIILPDEFDYSVLNICEAENIKLIQEREQEV